MKTSSILDLSRPLTAEFERDPKGSKIAQILQEYARSKQCWKDFALFAPSVYTRNLIERNEWFELLLLCWDAGQSSPIHNHAGQNCWMAVLEGEIEEVQFDCPKTDARCELVQRGTKTYVPGKVGFINDDIALHLVRPKHGRRGVSLHLYSRPIETCQLYDEATGTIVMRTMAYHSIRGSVVAK
ncbi:MAG: cysteine dioxygenase family protein [Planctomycetota bacterium]|nr:cysteine dioxygenase family protein [Planctomycetota bacterium]